MRTRIALLVLFASLLPAAGRAEEEDPLAAAVDAFVAARTADETATATAAIRELDPDARAVFDLLRAEREAGPAPFTGWQVRKHLYSDGKERAYHLYVPESYEPAVPAPVLIHQHGGVSRPRTLTAEEMEGYRDWWRIEAEEYGFLVVFPLGEKGAEWWTETQATALEAIVRDIGRDFHVDLNRVFATGFSDGGSGSFYLSMTHPTAYAGFIPLNGHPAVASAASGRNLFPVNHALRPLYVVNTQDDPLYPAVSILPFVGKMMEVGAAVRFTSYPGIGHQPAYRDEQNPLIAAWMLETERDPFPDRVVWETADLDTGRATWVTILGIGETPGAPALPDVNVMMPPGRVRIGITIDQEHEGPGVLVKEVSEGSLAAGIGLAPGDLVVSMDGRAIADLGVLRQVLGAKTYGDTVRIGWRRGDSEFEAEGTFPEFVPEPTYARTMPSGRIEVSRTGNRVDVRVRGVTRFALDLSPEEFDFGEAVVVTVNGEENWRGVPTPDLTHVLDAFARDRDPATLTLTRITLP